MSNENLADKQESILSLVSSEENYTDTQRYIVDPQKYQLTIMGFLKSQPKKQNILVNNGVEYMPISYVESLLDCLTLGAWHTEKFEYQVVGNEIIGAIELIVNIPNYGMPIRRTGAASVQIQFDSGAKVNEFEKKKPNALVKNLPTLKSMCIKNAASSLGKIFGRDLNRKFEHEFSEKIMEGIEKDVKESQLVKDMRKKTDGAN